MIRVHDPINLLPHLFLLGEPFESCNTDADVEIWPVAVTPDEMPTQSNVFTIFINTEPDIHHASTAIDHQHNLVKRPNSVFAVTATNSRLKYECPFSVIEFWSNMYFTLRQNENLSNLVIEEKPYDACALFGGWEAGRATIFEKLQQDNLVDQCLINLQPKWIDHQRFTQQQLATHVYYRSEKIIELDDPDFVRLSYTDTGLCTMNTVNSHRYSWVSQKIPYNIYNQVYWNIVTESEFHPFHDTIVITEKISKPLIAGQPILLFGAPGYLKHLKLHGFKTFDQWVDESYDKHYDSRPYKIIEAFKDFTNQTPTKKFEQFIEMQAVCEHNKKLATDPKFILAPIVDIIKKTVSN